MTKTKFGVSWAPLLYSPAPSLQKPFHPTRSSTIELLGSGIGSSSINFGLLLDCSTLMDTVILIYSINFVHFYFLILLYILSHILSYIHVSVKYPTCIFFFTNVFFIVLYRHKQHLTLEQYKLYILKLNTIKTAVTTL